MAKNRILFSNDFVLKNENVGINTTDPQALLDVNGTLKVSGVSTFHNNVNIAGTVGIGTVVDIIPYDTLSNGTLSFEGSAGQLFSITNNLTSGSIFSVNDVSGIPSIDVDADGTIQLAPFGSAEYVGVGKTNPTEKLDVAGNVKVTGDTYISGNTGIGITNPTYKLQVVGDFAATTKSFSIPHPTKQGMTLRYGSLESPYHGIRLTGSSVVENGKCIVELPDYIHKLVKEEGVNIHLTNIRHGKVLWVESVDINHNNFIVMTESVDGSYGFYWDFTAIRTDIDEMVVESINK